MSTANTDPNRNRSFTAVFNTQHASPGFQYVWDPNGITVGGVGISITGSWRPVTPTDLAGNSSTGTFTPTTSFITGSQTIIPAGYKSASVAIISGYGWVGGTGPFYAGTTLSYGGYDGSWMSSSALVVGGTGSTGAPTNIAIIWEN